MNTVSPDEAFQTAINLHRHGNFARAIDIYRQLLPGFPHNANLLHMYGSAELELGHTDRAVSLLRLAVEHHPENPVLQLALANGLMLQKHYSEAMTAFDRALTLQPGFAAGWFHRGNAFAVLGRISEACADYQQATKLNPQNAGAWEALGKMQLELQLYQAASDSFSHLISCAPKSAQGYTGRGNARLQLGKTEDAAADYRMALQYAPENAGAHFNYALALSALGRYPEAFDACSEAIRRDPKYAEAYACRGTARVAMEDAGEAGAAMTDFDTALSLQPNSAQALNDKGNALMQLYRHSEALECFGQVIAMQPEYYQAYCNRAAAKKALGLFDDAIKDFDRALEFGKDVDSIRWDKSLLVLLMGDYHAGWELFESRWRGSKMRVLREKYHGPVWQGENISDKTILLHAEQGFGDIIQFSRYIPLVATRAKQVIAAVPGAHMALLRALPGYADGTFTLVLLDDPPPDYDLHCPFMSLPRAFGTELSTVPADIPYLRANTKKCQAWQERLGPKSAPRIGLICSGHPGSVIDKKRSIPLKRFAPLFDLPFEFHLLQKEIRPKDAEFLKSAPGVKTHTEDLGDFSDTAALTMAMDLVISVDTSVAHLTGALGQPLWVLVPHVPDWRWTKAGETTPWYPAARIFRAGALTTDDGVNTENWGDVITRLSDALQIRFADYIQGL